MKKKVTFKLVVDEEEAEKIVAILKQKGFSSYTAAMRSMFKIPSKETFPRKSNWPMKDNEGQ